ncbi:hypothetical protein C8E00_103316 [Chromohalobacter marismortui]|uniref:Small CPxCG-related zinc finger protein n=1 Tax=Chromohalobacter marismortui TaxID=42055 RepID=A0A4R7NQA6_9GAMM|nr:MULTISPECIES: hypothetical protein [Chromohalobacter]MCI0508469.1 hypothetical protein [Chromohalobacter sp.]MCI0591811.1 hypothetical protein [Chromohalobacter sp.]TDU22948.1 hypothetical protein C8E00_103316 [Chromohalobacter marismortui]
MFLIEQRDNERTIECPACSISETIVGDERLQAFEERRAEDGLLYRCLECGASGPASP